MDSTKNFNYFFRRSPLFRIIFFILVIVAVIGLVFVIGYRTKPVPVIESITPPVGAPGDVVIIRGKNFGDSRDMSYVEISGAKLTASSYISWSDTKITLVLPANVQDGLVYVGTKDLRSKPSLFANEVDIPVPVETVKQTSKPVITGISQEKFNVGDLITISGNNFGDVKGSSEVKFTIDYNNKIAEADFKNILLLTENMVPASDSLHDVESWSNNEIKVHVPDGAVTGVIVVDNGTEQSEPFYYTIGQQIGNKTFVNKKIYLLQYTADVADIVAQDSATVTLRCPLPVQGSNQPDVELTDVNPQPVLVNYQNDLIQQVTRNKNGQGKYIFSQTFVLPVYEVKTAVVPEKITNYIYKDLNAEYLDGALSADELVPCDEESVKVLAAKITGKEKNPYKKAELIYEYMCNEFKIQSKVRKDDADPMDLIKSGKGDAYDFAVIYTALLRASGVPAFTDGGVLVCQDMMTQVHWWSEFYIEDFGWIPVDVALGAGLEYKKWIEYEETDDRSYYFGNLDSHHIQFSKGWNGLKPFSLDNKIVQRQRSFALQSIWEEASSNTSKYSSYWSVPVVKGVY